MTTYRQKVLAVVDSTDGFLTGQQIADAARLTYRQTIYALNALHNAGKIARHGRKFTARWGKTPEQPAKNSALALEQAFRGFFK